MSYVVGFDIGGTRLKYGAVDADGRLVDHGTTPTGYAIGPEAVVERLAAEVARLTAAQGAPPKAIGLGCSGAVDPDFGVVFLPGKLKGMAGFPLVPRLREATGVPCVADNDGRLSIRAEARYGQAQSVRWAVTVTLGTGVGSGVMLDGQILRDPHLQFGTQLSHMVLQADGGALCITGARGTAEQLCSATALVLAVQSGLARGIPSVLSDAYHEDPRRVDFAAVAEGVAAGDRLCVDEMARWRTRLGWLLVSAVHLYAPEVIILSGGAVHAASAFLGAVQAQVNDHIFRYPPGVGVPIRVSTLGAHAGVYGAAALAWDL